MSSLRLSRRPGASIDFCFFHWLDLNNDLSRIDAAFCNINGAISLLFCLMVIAERALTG